MILLWDNECHLYFYTFHFEHRRNALYVWAKWVPTSRSKPFFFFFFLPSAFSFPLEECKSLLSMGLLRGGRGSLVYKRNPFPTPALQIKADILRKRQNRLKERFQKRNASFPLWTLLLFVCVPIKVSFPGISHVVLWVTVNKHFCSENFLLLLQAWACILILMSWGIPSPLSVILQKVEFHPLW